jgi:hypothetical protein
VGVLGEGEEERPAHPRREELAKLLLDRGAEPYDMQVVYNIHFRGDVLWYLKLVRERATALGRDADWADPAWSMLDYGRVRKRRAVALGDRDQARRSRPRGVVPGSRGADPNAPPARDPRFPRASLHEEAMRRGQLEMARLFERRGARPSDPSALSDLDRFTAACMRLDRKEAAARSRRASGAPRRSAADHARRAVGSRRRHRAPPRSRRVGRRRLSGAGR